MKAVLSAIKHHSRLNPDAPAITSEHVSLTYHEFQHAIEAWTLTLLQLQCKRVGIYLRNSIEWLIVDLAIANAKAACIPIPLFFTSEQIRHLLEDAGVDAVIMSAKSDHESLLPVPAISHYEHENLQLLGLDVEQPQRDDDRQTKITYTSGSTGKPKGVCLESDTLDTLVISLAGALEALPIQRHLCLLPLATLLENVAGAYPAFYLGREVIVEDTKKLGLISSQQFEAKTCATQIERFQANSVIMLPQMLKSLVKLFDNENSSLDSLALIAVGGGKVSPLLINQAHGLGLPAYEGYGLSECASVVSLNLPGQHRPGSVGKPLSHVKVSIAEDGEVLVSGSAMRGYVNDSLQESVIHTGDLGYLDKDGYLYINGRSKNTIITGFGRNVSPEWVESVFLAEPAVQYVVVFGESQSSLSAVFVTQKGVSKDDLRDIVRCCNARLPDYARLGHWFTDVSFFEPDKHFLTANGKPRREIIANYYQQIPERVRAIS